MGHDKIENIDQYRALSRVVKAATVRCCKHNATRQWQVGDTHLWSLCTALASHAHHLVLLWPFVVVQCYAMDRDIVTNLQWNSMDLHMPYSKVLARMTLSDPEWLSEIFDDTEHRTVSATAELFVQYSPCDLCTMSVVADSRKSHMSSFCSAETQQHSFSRVVNYSRQKKCWADCTVFAMRLPSGQTLQTALSHILSGPLFTLSHKTSITCQCSILTIAS